MGKRLIAILLVFAASLPAAGSVWLLCQDGMLHAACCCASSEAGGTVADTNDALRTQLRRADCCTLTQFEKAPVVPLAGIDEFQLAAPTFDVQARFAWQAESRSSDLHFQPGVVSKVDHFQTGPPRFVAHCSWLI